jgi:hypothetical protein
MPYNKRFSQEISIFHGRQTPEKGTLVGYGAIIETLGLPMPFPNTLALISEKHRQYGVPGWIVDGRKLAFAGRGGASTDSELWVLENFLPKSK